MARYDFEGLSEQRRAAIRRLADARVLYADGHWRGAMYLAGYVIECRLKARLMEMHGCLTLKELGRRLSARYPRATESITTHNIEALLSYTGVLERMQAHADMDTKRAYYLCRTWRTSWRYHPEQGNEHECTAFLNAVDRLSRFIARAV